MARKKSEKFVEPNEARIPEADKDVELEFTNSDAQSFVKSLHNESQTSQEHNLVDQAGAAFANIGTKVVDAVKARPLAFVVGLAALTAGAAFVLFSERNKRNETTDLSKKANHSVRKGKGKTSSVTPSIS